MLNSSSSPTKECINIVDEDSKLDSKFRNMMPMEIEAMQPLKPSNFKLPGEFEFELMHRMKADKVFTEKFDKLLAVYSWKIHPLNHLKFYEEYLQNEQLIELL